MSVKEFPFSSHRICSALMPVLFSNRNPPELIS